MAKKKYTPDQIRNDSNLRREVCSGNSDNKSSNKKSSDSSFVEEVFDTVVSTVGAILDMGTPPNKKNK